MGYNSINVNNQTDKNANEQVENNMHIHMRTLYFIKSMNLCIGIEYVLCMICNDKPKMNRSESEIFQRKADGEKGIYKLFVIVWLSKQQIEKIHTSKDKIINSIENKCRETTCRNCIQRLKYRTNEKKNPNPIESKKDQNEMQFYIWVRKPY